MKFNPFSFCPYGNTNANAPMHWKPGKNLVCESVLLCVSMVLTRINPAMVTLPTRTHSAPTTDSLDCLDVWDWWA